MRWMLWGAVALGLSLGSLFIGAEVIFIVKYGRFPAGSGELANWLLGLGTQ